MKIIDTSDVAAESFYCVITQMYVASVHSSYQVLLDKLPTYWYVLSEQEQLHKRSFFLMVQTHIVCLLKHLPVQNSFPSQSPQFCALIHL